MRRFKQHRLLARCSGESYWVRRSPRSFWGPAVQEHFLAFAVFVGMNLANSANPVIARILLDLGLLNRPIGALIMTATIVDDLVNWTLFAIIL